MPGFRVASGVSLADSMEADQDCTWPRKTGETVHQRLQDESHVFEDSAKPKLCVIIHIGNRRVTCCSHSIVSL